MSRIDTFTTIITTLNRKRKVRVYIPTDYNESNKYYDVLYMHDGHNLFNKTSSGFGEIWDAHVALDDFYAKHKTSIILVGIDCDNKHRFDEYSPWKSNNVDQFISYLNLGESGGEGQLYLDWLVNELIVKINMKYRTTKVNYLAGSSMGGFISLYAGYKYPNIFKKIGAISSAIWFEKKALIKHIKDNFNPNVDIYLDVGTKEGINNQYVSDTYLQDTIDIANLLERLGCNNLKLIIVEDAVHS